MSNTLPTHYVTQYTTNVEMLLQQKGSRLRGKVMEDTYTGRMAQVVDQYGPVEAEDVVGRYQPIEPRDVPADARWVFPNDSDWSTIVDHFDKLRMLIDPTGSFTTNAVYGLGRRIDDRIIPAFFADSKTGFEAGTTTSFPGTQQVPVNFGAGSNTGLTVAKLKEAYRILMANEVDMDNEALYAGVNAKAHDALLNEAQAISLDYNSKPVLVDGKITRFMGFEFVKCERYQNDATPYRRIPVWAKSGMHLGVWENIRTDVSQRKDLRGQPWQVYALGTYGATRKEEKKIVEIKCNEA